ncbi:MAG: ATP synthase subunit I [Microthrixaceae bacterium]
MSDSFVVRVEGPSPAMAIATDLVKRSIWVIPVAAMISVAFWGLSGVASTMYAIGIVIINFLFSAYLLAVTGRINAALMGGAALFGFLMRLALIFAAVILVRDASWMSFVPFGITLILTHLVLLFWELRYVSSALAFPGLKPKPTPNPYLPSNSSGGDDSSSAATDSH